MRTLWSVNVAGVPVIQIACAVALTVGPLLLPGLQETQQDWMRQHEARVDADRAAIIGEMAGALVGPQRH